jgi:hypothetical protein
MDIRISTWTELQEAVFTDSWSDSIRRHRSNFTFRGMPRVSHGLETSLQAGGYEAQEKHLLNSFRKYAVESAVHGDWVWNWLCGSKKSTKLFPGTRRPVAVAQEVFHHEKIVAGLLGCWVSLSNPAT